MDFIFEKAHIKTWREIRQKGAITCHGHSIPPKCEAGICDSYPEVDLCSICNRCPCEKNIKYTT
jgi:hypothetical protein